MAIKTRAQLITENNTDFPDNVTQLISPADLRGQMNDTADSALFPEDIDDLDLSEADVTSTGNVTQTLAEWTEDILNAGSGFSTVASMLASVDIARGTGAIWQAGGFRYQEADPSSTDHHLTTAGGVKLYCLPSEDGWINFRAMNPAGDGATDDYPKLKKLLDIRVPGAATGNPAWPLGPSLFFPAGSYYMNPGVNGIQIKAVTHFRGVGPAFSNGWPYSELRFPVNNLGICFNGHNTLNGALETPYTGGAAGSTVRHMTIRGGAAPPSTNSDTAHGIEMRVMMSIEDTQVFNFTGDGIHGYGAATAGLGNCNLYRLSNLSIYGCRNGVYVDGPDANAGMAQQINASGNRRWGIWDSSFLGNTWLGCHCDGNGVATGGGNPADSSSVVTHSWTLNGGATTGSITSGTTTLTVNDTTGLFVGVTILIAGVTGQKFVSQIYRNTVTLSTVADATVSGAAISYADGLFKPASASVTEANLAATVPGTASIPGETATTVWEYWKAGYVHPYYPTWTAGKPVGTYFAGGGYRSDNANAQNVFVGCYQEQNGAGNSFVGPTIVLGGSIGGLEMDGGAILGGGGNTLVSRGGAFKTQGRNLTNAWLGGDDALSTILAWNHKDDLQAGMWRFRRSETSNDWVIDHANSAARRPIRFTGELTTEKMGTGAGVPFTAVFPTLAFGTGASVRRHTGASVVPTTGSYAAGDTIWNVAPGVGGGTGWRCTTAGTFGTLNAGATTGDITSGTTTLTVNSATGLTVGVAITIAGVTGTKWVTDVVGTTITIDTAASATVATAAIAYAVPVVTRFGEQVAQQVIATDAAFTLTPITSPRETRHTGTLTANRAYTLSTTNAYAGLRFRISRSGGGAFNLTNALKNIATDQWAEFVFDGTAWYLAAYGSLTTIGTDSLDTLVPPSGGAVTQATSKATGVTLNKISGQITTHNASLAANTSVSFTLTNSQIAAYDIVQTSIASGVPDGAYTVTVDAVAAGSCKISIYNRTIAARGDIIVISFAVIRGSIT